MRLARHLRSSLVVRAICLGVAGSAFGAAAAKATMLDFETANQLTNNFRVIYTGDATLSQTNNGTSNDYAALQRGTSNQTAVIVYDTTASDGTTNQTTFPAPLTTKLDLRISDATASNSFGVAVVDPSNAKNNLLALVNINSGATDTIRFFKDGDFTAGGAGTQIGTTVTGDTGADPGASAFTSLTVQYSVTGGVPQLSMTVGTLNAASSYVVGDALPSNVEVALRLNDVGTGGGTVDFDNFEVVVPEPAVHGMLGILGMGLMGRRRSGHR